MSSTHITHHVNAPRAIVYRALLDARAVAKWMVPDGMTSFVHAFDARELGRLARPHRLDAHRNDAQYYPIQHQRDGGTTIDLNQHGATSCPRLAARRCW